MSPQPPRDPYLPLDVGHPIWERFFTVAPLVVIGTREAHGEPDLAPKHMAGPFGWDNYFGFVCTPSHSTYANALRDRCFTVSYPRPDQVVLAGLAASPRCEDGDKPTVRALPTAPALEIDAPLLAGAYLYLECRLDRIVDGLGDNSVVIGKVVAGRVDAAAARRLDREDVELIRGTPLLVYLHPRRFATIDASSAFPFPEGYSR